MTKNPFINALAASLYIILVAVFMFYGSQFFGPEDTILMPIGMISLFTLSAAMMAYIFLYQPLLLLLDGHKKSAVDLFLKTVVTFGGITFFVFTLIFLGVFR